MVFLFQHWETYFYFFLYLTFFFPLPICRLFLRLVYCSLLFLFPNSEHELVVVTEWFFLGAEYGEQGGCNTRENEKPSFFLSSLSGQRNRKWKGEKEKSLTNKRYLSFRKQVVQYCFRFSPPFSALLGGKIVFLPHLGFKLLFSSFFFVPLYVRIKVQEEIGSERKNVCVLPSSAFFFLFLLFSSFAFVIKVQLVEGIWSFRGILTWNLYNYLEGQIRQTHVRNFSVFTS